MDSLVDFLRANEGTFSSKVCVKRKDEIEGNTVFAVDALAKGEVLMEIPFNLCISTTAIVATPLSKIFEDMPGLLGYQDEVLALGIMYAKSNNIVAPWCMHVPHLPETFNTPIYWSDEEIEELRPSAVYHLTKMMQKQLARDWENIHGALKEAYPDLLSGITFDMYKWAMSVIYSRAVGIGRRVEDKNGEAKEVYVRLIPPLMDMANHSPDAGTSAGDSFQYNAVTDKLALIASQEVQANEEVFICYGSYPNSKLAYSYGFVIPCANPVAAIDFWIKVTPNMTAAALKQKLLQDNLLTRQQAYNFDGTLRPNWIAPALLATVRVIQANGEAEFNAIGNAFKGKMISVRNETATYASLIEMLTTRMNVEAAEADKTALGALLLSHGSDTSAGVEAAPTPYTTTEYRKLMALVIRTEERELLSRIIGLLREWTVQLELDGEAFVPADCMDTPEGVQYRGQQGSISASVPSV